MKHINEYRRTETFCICAVDVENMAKISAHYGRELQTVAHSPREHEDSCYTCRLSTSTAEGYTIHDVSVRVGYRGVEELERELICDYRNGRRVA